ncbi:transmembrane protein 165 isoform X2 [Episyrphus balteatus]|uniref:transmembrane protein 165 isoform X2 n=1 Tax=Episyrphus balteatus TaxID=286459 RepID=UPI0024855603|nr:transmembrane protein 165 isoform X2 [Episyrphus balteatus]
MSQNQSYFWQTTRHNVYLKRSAKYHLMMALMVVLTFSTVCLAEHEPKSNDETGVLQTEEETKIPINAESPLKSNNINEQNVGDSPIGPKIETPSTKGTTSASNLGFIHAFIASISVILVSELGDKTFFIAAIMAMRHARLTVFVGAIAALGLMTVLSAVFGMAATIIPRVYTYYISTALFAIFGLKMLKEGYYMKATDAQEELEEVQSDLRKREDELDREVSSTLVQDPESGVIRKNAKRSGAYMASRIFMQAFTMTFLAEWGDRSQLTTIILAAREDVYGVIVGGVLGHSMCTGLAVIGGRMIAQKISVRTVTIVGGIVFLMFAITSLFMSPNED